MEEEKKDIVVEIPGLTSNSENTEKPKAPRPEFSPLPELEEDKPAADIIQIDDSGNVQGEKQPEVVEEKKEKPKKEKIKLNKLNSALLYILVGIIVIFVILCLLQFTNPDFCKNMWLGINGTLTDLLYSVMQYVPLLSSYGYVIIMVPLVIIIVIDIYVLYIKYKNDIEKKTAFENKLFPVLFVFGLIVAVNMYFYFSETSHRGINEMYMRDNLYATYTDEDLQSVVEYFKNRIITYAESLNRQNGKIELEKDPYDMSIDDLKNISSKYEFLKGSYPKKIRTLSSFDLMTSGYPLGLTYNYTVGIDDETVSDLNRIFVLTHEFCHVKGIVRESDADYCAFLAGFNSNNDISKYAMYVGLFPNLLYIMNDRELANSYQNELGTICLESGYDELCNLYYKDLYRFVSGADTIVLDTYSLSVYKDKKEELKQYLLGLNNRFGVTITSSDGKTISIDEANKLVDEGSSLYLELTGKITKDSYNKNISYLRTMANYFPHLYLDISTEQEDEYPGYNYLKPFPTNGNYLTLTEKAPEYSYDRAARSILEYFNKYVFN